MRFFSIKFVKQSLFIIILIKQEQTNSEANVTEVAVVILLEILKSRKRKGTFTQKIVARNGKVDGFKSFTFI